VCGASELRVGAVAIIESRDCKPSGYLTRVDAGPRVRAISS
jgi:hypothetical protein